MAPNRHKILNMRNAKDDILVKIFGESYHFYLMRINGINYGGN